MGRTKCDEPAWLEKAATWTEVPAPSPSEIQVAAGMIAWAGTKKTKAKGPTPPTKKRVERAQQAVKAFTVSGVWTEAKPDHFVELYRLLHTKVYGLEPTELAGAAWSAASMAAGKMLKREFDGDAEKMAEFFRWVWVVQGKDEKRRRAGLKDDDFKVTWRYQFSAKLHGQWRLAVMRGRA